MQLGDCGTRWPGEETAAEMLRCQRELGHCGAHVVDIDTGQGTHRFWWTRKPGDKGVNVYPQFFAGAR